MKVTIKTVNETEVDVKFFCMNVGPRFWEDGDVNGEEDIAFEEQEKGEKPRMPMAVENPDTKYADDKYRFAIKIDVKTGKIVGWPEGVEANIHYKVCDDGTYWLEDEDGLRYHEIESYVPGILDFEGDSDGDYIIMTVGKDGRIEEWWDKRQIDSKLEEFFEEEGF